MAGALRLAMVFVARGAGTIPGGNTGLKRLKSR
jgi:hypothetical protein